MIFEGVAVVAVLAFIVSRVLRQDKWLGSIIQLGNIQTREVVHKNIQLEKHEPQKSLVERLAISNSERIAFMLGILNIAISGYILGAWPQRYYLFYTPKALVLISLRWLEFRKRGVEKNKQKRRKAISLKLFFYRHYLLLDFCYLANTLLLIYVWLLPHRSDVFQIVFICANGPLAWAILAFNQSLVLHNLSQLTSVFVHIAPGLFSFGIRWHTSGFTVCESWPDCSEVGHFQLVWAAITRFYLWWIVFYYIFIFLMMQDYLKTRSYSTLYDRVAGNQMRALFSHQFVANLPELVKKGVYCLVHILFATFTMSVATMLFYSWYLHALFLLTMISMSAYNASSFYKAQFLQDAEEAKKSSR